MRAIVIKLKVMNNDNLHNELEMNCNKTRTIITKSKAGIGTP
jgi:hypothetical protein